MTASEYLNAYLGRWEWSIINLNQTPYDNCTRRVEKGQGRICDGAMVTTLDFWNSLHK